MAVHLVSIGSDIVADHPEDGDGASTGHGLRREPVGRTFETLLDAVGWLSRNHGLPPGVSDYGVERDGTLVTEVPRADHSRAQNGGWMTPTMREVEAWGRGELTLYSEHVRVATLGVPAAEAAGCDGGGAAAPAR